MDEKTTDRWLICGTRRKGYEQIVWTVLENAFQEKKPDQIIEGCCPDSADEYAERWAKAKGIDNQHYPANTGNYLKRNIEMVRDCTRLFAFWDGYSLWDSTYNCLDSYQ